MKEKIKKALSCMVATLKAKFVEAGKYYISNAENFAILSFIMTCFLAAVVISRGIISSSTYIAYPSYSIFAVICSFILFTTALCGLYYSMAMVKVYRETADCLSRARQDYMELWKNYDVTSKRLGEALGVLAFTAGKIDDLPLDIKTAISEFAYKNTEDKTINGVK